jgi:hypothetical protein
VRSLVAYTACIGLGALVAYLTSPVLGFMAGSVCLCIAMLTLDQGGSV